MKDRVVSGPFRVRPLVHAIRRQSLASAGAVALATGVAAPLPAIGQESLTIEEVIVTAQKRDESLQDVPISIDVIGQAELENLGSPTCRTLPSCCLR